MSKAHNTHEALRDMNYADALRRTLRASTWREDMNDDERADYEARANVEYCVGAARDALHLRAARRREVNDIIAIVVGFVIIIFAVLFVATYAHAQSIYHVNEGRVMQSTSCMFADTCTTITLPSSNDEVITTTRTKRDATINTTRTKSKPRD